LWPRVDGEPFSTGQVVVQPAWPGLLKEVRNLEMRLLAVNRLHRIRKSKEQK
jgi:hypothetical protein